MAAEDKEAFLNRWSRLKKEQKDLPAKDEKPAPELPPVDKLTPESDFSGFMNPKVEDALRRVALKKLFSDPHFNAADPFEPFSGDWTGGEPISDEMLATLNQARTHLFGDKKQEAPEEAAAQDAATQETATQETATQETATQETAKQEADAEQPKPDEPGKQDA
jgi:hypothetical protein